MPTEQSVLSPQSVLSVLEAARLILVEKTWVKGSFEEAGGYCAIGAVHRAAGLDLALGSWVLAIDDLVLDVEDALDEATDYMTAGAFDSIVDYNDAPATTLPDVLRVFDKAIARVG